MAMRGLLVVGSVLVWSTAPLTGSVGAVTAQRPTPRTHTVVSADLTVDGFDHYRFDHTTGPVATPAGTGGTGGGRTGGAPIESDRGEHVTVTAPPTNRGANLRAVWWFDDERAAVDHESCATWSEYSGPIVQAGVALRVRRVGGHTQAITVTNNIMWGARNGWNVHLWNDGKPGQLIGQAVLSHSFGPHDAPPPLPWRLCARVVGSSLQFKAWSLATHPSEPRWHDPGFGTSFALPRGWVYRGHAGWYAGHLQRGDTTGYRSLHSTALDIGSLDRVALTTHTVTDGLQRRVAARLIGVLRPAVPA